MASTRPRADSSTCTFFMLPMPGDHAEQVLHGTHLADLQELIVEIGKREFVGAHLLFELGGLLLVEGLLGLLNQREHVAHAENTRSHTLEVERLDHVELFAGADELDGLAGDGLDGQQRRRGHRRRAS